MLKISTFFGVGLISVLTSAIILDNGNSGKNKNISNTPIMEPNVNSLSDIATPCQPLLGDVREIVGIAP